MMPPGGAVARADARRHARARHPRARDRSRSSAPCSTRSSRGRPAGPGLRRRRGSICWVAARLREVRSACRPSWRPRSPARRRSASRPGRRRARRTTSAASATRCERHVELRHRYVACFEGFEHPYDVLLDDFEPGLTTAELRPLFAELRDALVPLVSRRRRRRPAAQRRRLARHVRRRRRSGSRSSTCSRRSASTSTAGGWTRRCTRSPPALAPTTCG